MIQNIHIFQYKSVFWSNVCVGWQGIKSTKCTKRSYHIASTHTPTLNYYPRLLRMCVCVFICAYTCVRVCAYMTLYRS